MSDAETIRFEPWSDAVYERHGFPIRSVYVEFCYAGVIGPTSLLLLRRVAVMLEGAEGKPVTVDVAELAESLGVGTGTGNNSPIQRTLRRLERFALLRPLDDGSGYAVPLFVPPLSRARLTRSTPNVQRIHERLMARHDAERSEAG